MGIVLGLTGGIATGKSTAAQVFWQAGFPVIDADRIARDVVEPGTPGLKALQSLFGTEIITEQKRLNRKKLGELIFSDKRKREELNQCLAPFIRASILANIEEKKRTASVLIVDIPLLYESGYDKFVDLVAVVYVPEAVQVTRLMQRDDISKKKAMQRINAQLPIKEKRKKADIVFENVGTERALARQINLWLSTIKEH